MARVRDHAPERRPRIAIVGPTHPYTGGISAHTTTLANQLIADGHSVAMVSWRAQYPKFLRGGQTRVPDGEPEVVPVPGTTYPLAWYNPFSWFAVGRRLRRADAVIVTAITPYHAIPYIVLAAGLGHRPHRSVIAHNVLPHEGGPLDRILVRALYRSFGRVLVHSSDQEAIAKELAPESRTAVAKMPLPDIVFGAGLSARGLAESGPPARQRTNDEVTLLFFGMIREYKGVDVLLRAMANVDNVKAIIAGEFWQPVEEYRTLIDELGIGERVRIVDGYVKFTDLPDFFEHSDALVLPYRHGTATFNVSLAHLFGLPVVSTDAGTLARDVHDGVDGLVAKADDVASLAGVLGRLTDAGVLDTLRAGVHPAPLGAEWRAYAAELTRLALSR